MRESGRPTTAKDPPRAEEDSRGFGQSPGSSGPKDFFDGIFEEILEDFFGAKSAKAKKKKGADLRYSLEISLEEAAFGSQKSIRFNRKSVCPLCRGSRCAPGTEPQVCPYCEGAGALQSQRGFFIVETACERCKGEGEYIPRPCPRCGGSGHVKTPQTFTIKTPPGAEKGTRLRMAGEGETGQNGGPAGDLFVVLSVLQHPVFTRFGERSPCEIPIPLIQAFRGGEIQVPVLNGTVRMKVPPKTPPGQGFRPERAGDAGLARKGKGEPESEDPGGSSRPSREKGTGDAGGIGPPKQEGESRPGKSLLTR